MITFVVPNVTSMFLEVITTHLKATQCFIRLRISTVDIAKFIHPCKECNVLVLPQVMIPNLSLHQALINPTRKTITENKQKKLSEVN